MSCVHHVGKLLNERLCVAYLEGRRQLPLIYFSLS
jgi:hypothetical protein